MSVIPRTFHFIYGLKPQDEAFPLLHYLCLASCIAVNAPGAVQFHTYNMPWGPWWERIRDRLDVRKIEPERFVERTTLYKRHHEGAFLKRLGLDYAHHADFLRLEILLEEGGVYADIDTLFIESIPEELFSAEFVMAQEGFRQSLPGVGEVDTLCNALIMSRPEAGFAQTWYERMFGVFDGTWNRHSCVEPALVAREMPERITIAPARRFFAVPPTPEGIARLFMPSDERLDGVSSIHLWEHLWGSPRRTDFSRFHAGMITESYVRSGRSLYARLATPYL